MSTTSDTTFAGYLAAVAAAVMIATQVASKATRDALFLSNFDIDQLPLMLAGGAMFSLVSLLWVSRTMTRHSPAYLIPVFFGSSAVLLIVEWLILARFEPLASVLLYLHVAAFGSFLVSGFWSIVNERFDPRTAKQKVGLIAGGGTLGGLIGGVGAERVAALASTAAMFPLMALGHVACGVLVFAMRPGGESRKSSSRGQGRNAMFAGLTTLGQNRYLRNIAWLVLAATTSATLLDYVFKARAFAAYDDSESLMRYFAVFYAGVGLLTFLLQTLLGRPSLERLGLAGTIILLPAAIGVGGAAMLLLPGLVLAGLVRGSESALRSSLFRSGYELLYTPVSVREKRPAKSLVDVGVDRVGDAAGALLIRLFLIAIPGVALSALLLVSIALAGLAAFLARSLDRGYVEALKNRMVDRAGELDIPEFRGEAADSIVLQTIGSLDVSRVLRRGQPDAVPGRTGQTPGPASRPEPSDPLVAALADLRSGWPDRVRQRLGDGVDPMLAGQAIALLAWSEVSDAAIDALGRAADKNVGQLIDRLLDPLSDFAVRRRIPRILATCDSPRAVDGLIEGFSDHRFEVRYQCAAALVRIRERVPATPIPPDRIESAVLRDLDVDAGVWRNRRLLDSDQTRRSSFSDGRRNLSLEHVFRLLSLMFEEEPLEIALQGLHTTDPQLRGTAMEYLESVLPQKIQTALWRFLEEPAAPRRKQGRTSDPRAELLMSRKSIQINLRSLEEKP